MSDLRPKGTLVMVNGAEHNFLFSLNVVDDLQEHYRLPIDDVIGLMIDEEKTYAALRYILMVLMNDEAERLKYEKAEHVPEQVTERQVGSMVSMMEHIEIFRGILKAYGTSLPEADEFESPNAVGGQQN